VCGEGVERKKLVNGRRASSPCRTPAPAGKKVKTARWSQKLDGGVRPPAGNDLARGPKSVRSLEGTASTRAVVYGKKNWVGGGFKQPRENRDRARREFAVRKLAERRLITVLHK